MGIKDFFTQSDGVKVANPKHLYTHQKRLKRAQQALSKKKKGSCNRNKARLKVAKLHERITNLRTNFHHQLSRQLINDNQVIGIETLKVANMVKNRKLAKAISDVSWSSFFNKLIYKSQESQHCTVVRMDTYYPSSHICSETKEKLDRKLKLSERSWTCPYCGKTHDRDINAAVNIRDQAVKVIRDITRTTGKQPYGQLILA
jgi:putative transposase